MLAKVPTYMTLASGWYRHTFTYSIQSNPGFPPAAREKSTSVSGRQLRSWLTVLFLPATNGKERLGMSTARSIGFMADVVTLGGRTPRVPLSSHRSPRRRLARRCNHTRRHAQLYTILLIDRFWTIVDIVTTSHLPLYKGRKCWWRSPSVHDATFNGVIFDFLTIWLKIHLTKMPTPGSVTLE